MTALLRTILVPLDGSELAEQALAPAVAIAHASGAALHLTRVFVTYDAPREMLGQGEMPMVIEQQLEQEAWAYLKRVAERVATELPEQVRTDRVRTRPLQSPFGETAIVVDSLRRLARRLRPDLVVMATHARGGLSRAWLGSVADALMRSGTVPTLLIRPRDERAATPVLFRHILLPLNGSALAEESLSLAQTLATLFHARLTLLRVIVPQLVIARPSPVTRVNEAHVAEQEAAAARYLATVKERVMAAGLSAETATVVAEHPARAILEYAANHETDLIAMSTRGLGGMKRFMIGSVADKVLRGTPVPVLLTKPAARNEGAAGRAAAE
jgi:nucleotide-binding universal stress UspA family protein